MPIMLALGSTCGARLCLLLRLSLARSPHALHSVMPHRHLGVSVAPHEWQCGGVAGSGLGLAGLGGGGARALGGFGPFLLACAAAMLSASRPHLDGSNQGGERGRARGAGVQ